MKVGRAKEMGSFYLLIRRPCFFLCSFFVSPPIFLFLVMKTPKFFFALPSLEHGNVRQVMYVFAVIGIDGSMQVVKWML